MSHAGKTLTYHDVNMHHLEFPLCARFKSQ